MPIQTQGRMLLNNRELGTQLTSLYHNLKFQQRESQQRESQQRESQQREQK